MINCNALKPRVTISVDFNAKDLYGYGNEFVSTQMHTKTRIVWITFIGKVFLEAKNKLIGGRWLTLNREPASDGSISFTVPDCETLFRMK